MIQNNDHTEIKLCATHLHSPHITEILDFKIIIPATINQGPSFNICIRFKSKRCINI